MPKSTFVVLRLGSAQTLAWGSTYYLPAILANAIARELGVGTEWVFIAFSAGMMVSAFLGPVAGRLIDAHGGRWVLAASNLVLACGLALLGTSSGIGSLLASWIVIGVGMSLGLYEAAFSSLARIYGGDARRAITGITLIAGFASTVAWPLSAYMDVTIGWRATCFAWAIAHLVLGLPLNLSLPTGRAADTAQRTPSSGQGEPRRPWIAAALAFVFASAWFCSTAMAAHLPRLLQEAGASLTAAVAAAALVGPAQVAARVLEFGFMRRAHPLVSARIAILCHPVAAAGLISAGAPGAVFFTVLHGAGNGVMTIVMGTLPLALFGAAGYGLRQGLLMAPARLLQSGAPFVFDLLLTRYGTGALLFTAFLGLASFIVLLALPERSRVSTQEP